MSDNLTLKMLEAYYQDASPTMFLSSMFRTPALNFYNSKEVEIDVVRSGEEIAIALQSIEVSGNENVADEFTNKRFAPPVLKEVFNVNAFETMDREAGMDPFADINFKAHAFRKIVRGTRLVEAKIQRTVELQCAQALQTGIIDLKNSAGVTVYTIDYKAKASHFPTVATPWDDANADIWGDLQALADQIRKDGKVQADRLIFGSSAWAAFIQNAKVQAIGDNRRLDLMAVAPKNGPEDATWQGYIWVGGRQFEMWSYDCFYDDPQSGNSTEYVDPKKVIMTSTKARFDLTYGAIPRIVAPDSRLRGLVPERIFRTDRIGLSTNAWLSENGENIKVQVGTRPLAIPTAIDRYGCLTILA